MPPATRPDRRKANSPASSVIAALASSVEPLSAIIEILWPRAGMTILSIGDDGASRLQSPESDEGPICTSETVGIDLRRRLAHEDYLMLSLDDPDADPTVRALLECHGMRSAVLAGLLTFEHETECVVIYDPHGDLKIGRREKRLLSAAIAQARIALDNAGLRARDAKRQMHLEAIARLGVIFTSVLDLKEAAGLVVDYASLVMELPAFALLFRPEGSPDFVVLATEGLPQEASQYSVKPIEVAGLDVRVPGELAVRPLDEVAEGGFMCYLRDEGYKNILVAPLIVGEDRMRGVLIGLDRRVAVVPPDDRDAFHLLALQATNAIWNAERYEAEVAARHHARRQLEVSTLLLNATDLLSGSLNPAEVLDGLVGLLVRATERRRVSVSLYDAEARELIIKATHGMDQINAGLRLPLSSLSREARQSIAERRSMVADYESPDTPPESLLRTKATDARLALSVPLVFKGEVIGVIGIDEPGERREFTHREIDIVEGIASAAAVSMENARLFEQHRGVAETLQEALLILPDHIVGIKFAHAYHAASDSGQVGGDFYDVFELEHDRLGVIVGDIAGKGLKAAVLTSLLKYTLRAHTAEPEKSPADILRLTNDVVFSATASEQFATVFFGIIDRRTGRFSYANAAHTTGAVVRPGGSVLSLPANGPLVGAFPQLVFGETELRLGPDDTLFLYTDGLTEAGVDGRQLGEDRLFEILSGLDVVDPDAVLELVIKETRRFSGGTLHDDVAMLAVQLLGSSEAVRKTEFQV